MFIEFLSHLKSFSKKKWTIFAIVESFQYQVMLEKLDIGVQQDKICTKKRPKLMWMLIFEPSKHLFYFLFCFFLEPHRDISHTSWFYVAAVKFHHSFSNTCCSHDIKTSCVTEINFFAHHVASFRLLLVHVLIATRWRTNCFLTLVNNNEIKLFALCSIDAFHTQWSSFQNLKQFIYKKFEIVSSDECSSSIFTNFNSTLKQST